MGTVGSRQIVGVPRAIRCATSALQETGGAATAAVPRTDYRDRENKDVRVLVVGPTGYIGKFVTKELIRRGYNVVAFAREKSGIKGKASKEDTINVRPLF